MFFDRLLVFLGLKRPNEESPSPHLSSVRARPVSGTKLRTLDDLSRVLGVDSKALESFDVRYHQFRIAKLICHAETREACIQRTLRALREFKVGPIKTTIPLQARLMQDENFRKGGVDIHYLERLLAGKPH